MTGTLRDVMREQADAQASPVFDVEAIAAAGNRRLRRTRVATGSLVVAAFALAAVGLPQLVDGAGTTDADGLVAEAAEPFADRKVGFAAGDVIQWGEETFSVGATIAAYVQTDDGFVYTTEDGGVWFYDGASSERVGLSTNRTLRADDTGSLVAWVARAADGHPQYVVFDTHTRAPASTTMPPGPPATPPTTAPRSSRSTTVPRTGVQRAASCATTSRAARPRCYAARRRSPTRPTSPSR